MFVIIGAVVVLGGVLTGFIVAGGNPMALIQISEFITIGSAAIGSLLISAPLPLIKKIIAAIIGTLSSHDFSKQDYLEILKSLNDLFLVAQRDGLLAIEKHIENPEQSDIIGKNKKFIGNEFYRSFFADTMKVMLSGGVPPHELEGLIEAEIETFTDENKPVTEIITKTGDALPGFGIVAAVLGIIITMSSISAGPEKVGEHVAAALVGTFLGILISYGFINPLASIISHGIEGKARFLGTLKTCIIAYAKGNPPIIAVEIARRTIYSDSRPSFAELESYIRAKNA